MLFEEFCSKYNIHLNAQQEKAVKSTDGATLLLAAPGSGKTTVIVARTGYMVKCKNIPPRNILNLTFTTAAAKEMKERFLRKFDLTEDTCPHFSTINSFCVSVLRSYCKSSGIQPPALVTKTEPIICEALKSL